MPHASAPPDTIWFETGKPDRNNRYSYLFTGAVEKLELRDPDKLGSFLERLESLSTRYWLAGYFSYELGYLLEPSFTAPRSSGLPYAVFCAYPRPAVFDHRTGKPVNGTFTHPRGDRSYRIDGLRLNTSHDCYVQAIERIKHYIAAGDIYQANYTIKYRFGFEGSPFGLYSDLKEKQRVAYNTYARLGDLHILSHSPELFFEKHHRRIRVKPMKGTMARGRTYEDDVRNREFLRHDPKNRAENVMIVDLLRNDLGRVCEYNSVQTTSLFDVERFDTLFQMTSTVRGLLRRDISLPGLVRAVFPSGSVTGAPKIRAMEIIRELENGPRGVYTGAIGFISPHGRAVFNVPIRTILIRGKRGEMGVGGGIVADSQPEDEFAEAKLKAQFLIQRPQPPFQVIETMYCVNNRVRNFSYHTRRLEQAADYFGYRFSRHTMTRRVRAATRNLDRSRHKVRVLWGREGLESLTTEPVEPPPAVCRLTVSPHRVDDTDPFFHFKTTRRELYNQELKRARRQGYYDVLFVNRRGLVTEGAITNVYARIDGILSTPPVANGLLAGTMRTALMKRRRIEERELTLEDLARAEELFVSNAVIGLCRAAVDTQ